MMVSLYPASKHDLLLFSTIYIYIHRHVFVFVLMAMYVCFHVCLREGEREASVRKAGQCTLWSVLHSSYVIRYKSFRV